MCRREDKRAMRDTQGSSNLQGEGRETGSRKRLIKSVQKSENPQGTHGFISEFNDVSSLGNSYYHIASPPYLSSVLGVLNGTFCISIKRGGKKRENMSLKLTVQDV